MSVTMDGENASEGSTSLIRIVANIFISFIGAGVLGLPYAFKESGIVEGVLIMLFIGLISIKAMLLLIDCKKKLIQKSVLVGSSPGSAYKASIKEGASPHTEVTDGLIEVERRPIAQVQDPINPPAPGKEINYGDVGYYAIGNSGRLLVEFAIVVSQIGFCCAYLIFILENIADYVEYHLKTYQWLLIILPPLGLLTLLRHLNSLAISSLFAQMSTLMAFAVVFWFDFDHIASVKSLHPREFSLVGFPFFMAVAMYCYEGAGMILSLESSVHKDYRSKFKLYFKITMVAVTLLYVSFGVAGYLSFGENTNSIITLNLPKGEGVIFAIVVKSCLCLSLFFTYPVMMYPVVHIIEKKLITDPKTSIWSGNMIRFVLVTLTGLVVLLIPNFTNLMALVGATCCTMLAFILPGIFHISIYRPSITKWQYCVDIFIIILGVFGTVIGTWDAVKRLHETPDPRDLSPSLPSSLNSTKLLDITSKPTAP